ncbi:alpha/beta hydrolase [Treponema primitia]|uniref:alpha/beta hydrolase n=1 Tax=Treponema primitia TaxID=88058 RepID=UPI0002555644|nr:alpha/beta hydrolase [Treponema primitia]
MGKLARFLLQDHWKKTKREDDRRIATLTPTAGVAEDKDIPYRNDGTPLHRLDVYYPEGSSGLLPTIVDIHGGGWMYGDKELNKYYCLYLASQGFAVLNVSYRLLPETDLKGQVQDIFDSLHWLERNGEQHHCDTKRVFLTGDSAGGHLAGLTACIQLSGELQTLYGAAPVSFAISALAINHGVCDPVGHGITGYQFTNREMDHMFFGSNPTQSPLYAKANFQDTAQGLSLPPILLVSSEADDYHSRSLALKAYLDGIGASSQVLFWTKAQGEKLGHVFNILYPHWPESVETNKAICAFFTASA